MNRYLVQVRGTSGEWISIAGFVADGPLNKMLRNARVAIGEEYRVIDRENGDKTVHSGIR